MDQSPFLCAENSLYFFLFTVGSLVLGFLSCYLFLDSDELLCPRPAFPGRLVSSIPTSLRPVMVRSAMGKKALDISDERLCLVKDFYSILSEKNFVWKKGYLP